MNRSSMPRPTVLALLALALPAGLAAQKLDSLVAHALPGVESRIALGPTDTVFLTDAGQGDVVVLVSGLLGSSYQFRRIAPLLVDEGFRVLAPELPGVARGSRSEQADYSLAAQGDRIIALLDSLGIDRAYLLAHTVGGSIVLRAASRHPDRVEGILLLEAGASETATTPGLRLALNFAFLLRLPFSGGIKGKVRGTLRDKSADPSWVNDTVVAGYMVGGEDRGAAVRALNAFADAKEPDSLAPHLAQVTAPVLMLLGGHPHEGGPQGPELAMMRERLPVFVIDTVPGVGHFPHEEAPAAVVDAMFRLRAASACVRWATGVEERAACLSDVSGLR
jgi:pimeloyl-ACP methyl ester carboxylesterase